MNENIRFAIFGCGVIAKTHAKAISEAEGVQLVGCSDINYSVAKGFADTYNISAYSDISALLSSEEVDAVSICTPSGTHAELAVKVLSAGKHAMLEKPMALSTIDCDRVIEAAERSGAFISIISQMRTSPDVKRAKKIISSGMLGKIVLAELDMRYWREEEYYRGNWRGTKKMDGGGALMNQGIHGVDLLLYLLGPVKKIQSSVRTLFHNIEVEDTAVATLEFNCGALGTIAASTAAYPGCDRELKISGTRGTIELREDRITRLNINGREEPCQKFSSSRSAESNVLLDCAGHKRQYEGFACAIRGAAIDYVSSKDGKMAVELIENIYNLSI